MFIQTFLALCPRTHMLHKSNADNNPRLAEPIKAQFWLVDVTPVWCVQLTASRYLVSDIL